MAGPWEDFAPAETAPAPAAGPWSDFQPAGKPAEEPDTRSWWERGAVKPTTLTTDPNLKPTPFAEWVKDSYLNAAAGIGSDFANAFKQSPEEMGRLPLWQQMIGGVGEKAAGFASLGKAALGAASLPLAPAFEAATEGTSSVMAGAGVTLGNWLAKALGQDESTLPEYERIKEELKDQVGMAWMGMGSVHWAARPKGQPFAPPQIMRAKVQPDGTVRTQVVGEFPNDADFKTSAELLSPKPPGEVLRERLGLTGDATEANLRRLWDQDGIHPAEAVHDAKNDAFLRNELTAPTEPYDPAVERELDAKTDRILLGQEEGEIPRRAVGAEVTDTENLPSLAEQPPPPLGTLRERATNSAHELLGMSKNLAWILDPMSQGSKRAMVLAKDTISMIRRIDWEWNRADQDIYKNFTREQRERMWNAADEESVALQLGESLEHQGLATLDPDEFTAVRREHIRAMKAWDAYVESGAVEGDGLPAYTPRMVLNVALADEHVGPQDLNRLGHDVFTRTAQMRERKHLMAEDTEAAAKERVRKSMEERGASPEDIEAAVAKVQIARDIRTVPLATARLEKAVVYRNMLNELRKIGDATGKKLVLEGEPPPGYFTIRGNPAFTTWRPMLEKVQDVAGEPYWRAVKNEDGNVVMRPEPISLPNEFEGPLRSIMDEAPSKNPLARGAMTAYDGIMMLKSKAMHVILNSPLIHGAVVWGKVFPAEPQWLGIRTIFTGRSIIRDDPVRASQLIERGLAPVGRRGGVGQDISGVMELPELQAGRGWTAQSAGLVARMFRAGEKGEIATRDFVDKAGDFMHNTLLWDRVTEAQFGLASHLSDDLVARGASRVVADRIGAHFSNMIVGAMPKEAMSAGARAAANFIFFSRSFTFGNLQMVKQAVVGLPKPIVAQIERDMGVKPGTIVNLGKDEYAEVQGPQMPENYLKSLQRRRAIGRAGTVALGIIAVDYVVSKITNSLLQNAVNVAVNDSTWDEEFHGYAQHLAREWEKRTTNPYELLSPLNITPMSDNEPSKTNRIFMGYDKDGRAIYGKNPTGKYPEEIVDWLTGPWDTMRRKGAPFPGAFLDVLVNSDALGRKIMDKTDDSLLGMVKNSLRVAEHFVEHHLPMEQLEGLYDLSTGQGDTKVNAGRAFAPVAGFTISRGAPGGMGKGEYYSQRDSVQAKFDIAKPALRKQIMNGDIEGAQAAMARIGMPPRDQIGYIRSVQNPNRIGQQGMQRFNYGATPEQQDRFERARERDQGARQ